MRGRELTSVSDPWCIQAIRRLIRGTWCISDRASRCCGTNYCLFFHQLHVLVPITSASDSERSAPPQLGVAMGCCLPPPPGPGTGPAQGKDQTEAFHLLSQKHHFPDALRELIKNLKSEKVVPENVQLSCSPIL